MSPFEQTWRRLAFLASAAAAGIHLGAVHEHFDEYAPAGAFMLTSGLAQLVWAVWIAYGAPRRVILVGMLGNAGIVALWIVTRTAGLPFGPEPGMPEDIHGTDALATTFEVVVVMAAIALASSALPRPEPMLARLVCLGALFAPLATGHDPTHGRVIAAATLTLALAGRAVAVALSRSAVFQSDWRSHDQASFPRSVRAGIRAPAGAAGSARG